MRILFLNDYGHLLGGAEVYASSLSRQLEARGHEVLWLTSESRGGGTLAEVPRHEPRFHAGPVCRGVSGGSALRRAAQQWANFSAEKALRRTLREFRPDVVHLHGFLGRLSPRVLTPLAGVPALATLHTYKAICPKGTKALPDESACRQAFGTACVTRGCLSPASYLHERSKRAWSGSAFRNLRLLLAPSRFLLERFREVSPGLPLVHFPYGTDFHDQRLPRRDGRRQILFAGRLSPSKGVDRLLRAFQRIAASRPEARCIIAGEGPERERLLGLRDQLGLRGRVELVGHCDRSRLAELHAESDCCVVPSRWPEVSGITVMEALAAGTPVVAPAVGGIGELVRSGVEGWCVPPGDALALADAMLRILVDAKERRRMQAAALRRAEAFRLSAQLPLLEALYDALTRGRGSRSLPAALPLE